MKAYLAQLPILAWFALLLPALVVAYVVLITVGPEVVQAVIPHSVCVLLRIL
jgi:hypothetical protein